MNCRFDGLDPPDPEGLALKNLAEQSVKNLVETSAKNHADASALAEPGDESRDAAAGAPGTTFQLAGTADIRNISGVALVTDERGRVIDATDAAAPLATALGNGAQAMLGDLVSRARAVGPLCEPFSLGGAATWNLAVLPLSHGGALVIGRETTLERNLRDALVDSRQRYKDFVECSSDFSWETDATGRFVFVSPRGALGYSAREITGRDARDMLHDRHRGEAALPFHSREPREAATVWMRASNGEPTCLEIACLPLTDGDGRWIGARGVCRDVTEEWERQRALDGARHRERLVAGVVNAIREEANPEKLLARTANATREALDASFCAIYRVGDDHKLVRGVAYGENIGQALCEQLDERINWLDDEAGAVELPLDDYRVLAAAARHRDSINGAICAARPANGEPWSEDDHALIAGVVGQLGIAIEQFATHEALKKLSRTDDLTGLKNRRAFMDSLHRRHKHSMRTGRPAALLYTDLDNFKLVNDVHGHQRGDEVLILVAEVLERTTRVNDVTARFGGDEFAIWLDEIGEADAIAKAVLMLKACAPLEAHSGDADHPLRLSIGVAVFDPASGEDLESLIARADTAMYQAKHTGEGTYALAPPAKLASREEEKTP